MPPYLYEAAYHDGLAMSNNRSSVIELAFEPNELSLCALVSGFSVSTSIAAHAPVSHNLQPLETSIPHLYIPTVTVQSSHDIDPARKIIEWVADYVPRSLILSSAVRYESEPTFHAVRQLNKLSPSACLVLPVR